MNKAKQVIRSTADRLKDMERGSARLRAERKQDDLRKHSQERAQLVRRYKANPEAVIAEMTFVCLHCGTSFPPQVLPHPVQPDDLFIIPHYTCCCEAAIAERAAEEERAGQGGLTYEQIQRRATLNAAGLRGELAHATFETYEGMLGTKEGQRKDMVREYCDMLLAGQLGTRSWLVMHGDVGTGKTHLGAAVLHKAIDAGLLCYLRVWPEWLESLQATFNGRGDSGAIVRELKLGRVVMIDDVDKYPPPKGDTVSWAQSKLFTALNERYDMRRPTILTFNHTPREMTPWLGAALVDRMIERAHAVIHCQGKSWRSGQTWNV